MTDDLEGALRKESRKKFGISLAQSALTGGFVFLCDALHSQSALLETHPSDEVFLFAGALLSGVAATYTGVRSVANAYSSIFFNAQADITEFMNVYCD